jgi:hypothetical protein
MSALSAGQAMLLKALAQRARMTSKLGPLKSCADRVVDRGLAERFAPGDCSARTAIRITPAGVAALAAHDRAALAAHDRAALAAHDRAALAAHYRANTLPETSGPATTKETQHG